MQSQLRIYSIKEGLLDEFVEFWRSEIVPLRRRFGFEVAGAWADAGSRTFAWVVCHPDFERAAADYYESPAPVAQPGPRGVHRVLGAPPDGLRRRRHLIRARQLVPTRSKAADRP